MVSSSTIVTTPVPSTIAAPTGLLSTSPNVSFGSITVSPLIVIATVLRTCPARNVTVVGALAT